MVRLWQELTTRGVTCLVHMTAVGRILRKESYYSALLHIKYKSSRAHSCRRSLHCNYVGANVAGPNFDTVNVLPIIMIIMVVVVLVFYFNAKII